MGGAEPTPTTELQTALNFHGKNSHDWMSNYEMKIHEKIAPKICHLQGLKLQNLHCHTWATRKHTYTYADYGGCVYVSRLLGPYRLAHVHVTSRLKRSLFAPSGSAHSQRRYHLFLLRWLVNPWSQVSESQSPLSNTDTIYDKRLVVNMERLHQKKSVQYADEIHTEFLMEDERVICLFWQS